MKTNILLKGIASWRKQLILDLSQHLSQQKLDLDRLILPQIAQELIYQVITLHICQDNGIPANMLRLQPCSIAEDLIKNWMTKDRLYRASEYFSALKQTCQISVLPIELLGQLYEQFWATHQAIDRKAQGVYYTPTAIIDYTIHHTVGTVLSDLLLNKTLADLHRNQVSLRILDPACGAGAFLLRAYQFLLSWYQSQYETAPEHYGEQLYQNHQGNWQLTIAVKQHILLQHIYGLDINQQAVEVAKRSLFLQMLSGSVTENQIQPCCDLDYLFNQASLNTNLLCGNTLIDQDFYAKHEQCQFTLEETEKINAFSWEKSFPEVIQAGGFDVVFGNPPWVFTRGMAIDDRIKQYYQAKYLKPLTLLQRSKAKQTGKVNLFILFLLKFIEVLHPKGRIGIVVPNTLLRTTVYETARKYMLDRCSIEQIVDLGGDAFSGITASSAILILGKNLENSTIKLVNTIHSPESQKPSTLLQKSDFLNNIGYVFSIFRDSQNSELFEKLNAVSTPLKHLTTTIIEGIVCRKDQIYQELPHQELHQLLQQQANDRNQNQDKNQYKKLLEGKDIARYCITFREKYILFDRQQLHRPRPDYVWNAQEKIILRRIGGGDFALVGALDTEQYYAFASTNNILLGDNHRYNIRYILALLNSKLLNYYYIQNFTNRSRLTVNIAKTFLEQLPIRSINFACSLETLQHDRLVAQVNFLQDLHQQLCFTQNPSEQQKLQQKLQQKIEAIDQQIDQWVYELYDLTEIEIALIETSYRKTHQTT